MSRVVGSAFAWDSASTKLGFTTTRDQESQFVLKLVKGAPPPQASHIFHKTGWPQEGEKWAWSVGLGWLAHSHQAF